MEDNVYNLSVDDITNLCIQFSDKNEDNNANLCKSILGNLLGYLNDDIIYTSEPEVKLNNISNEQRLKNFYSNWSTNKKVRDLNIFLTLLENKITNSTSDLYFYFYSIGYSILNFYFDNPDPITNQIPTIYYSVAEVRLLEILYQFGYDSSNGGIFGYYLKFKLCKDIDLSFFTGNINYRKWCGCYADYTAILEKINVTNRNQIIDSNKKSGDSYNFGNQCMPYCTNVLSIKLFTIDDDGKTLFPDYSNLPSNQKLPIFNQISCVSTICFINEQSVNSEQVDGIPTDITQQCQCANTEACICIIAKDIDKYSNGLGSIEPGLDNPVNLKQVCGGSALCFTEDQDGNIGEIDQCPTDNEGNPQPSFPSEVVPEDGKYKPFVLDSIKYLNINFMFVLITILFIGILFFMSVRYSVLHSKFIIS